MADESSYELAVLGVLAELSEVYHKPEPTPAALAAWVRVLGKQEVAETDLDAALDYLLANSRFFPTPADFLEAVKKTRPGRNPLAQAGLTMTDELWDEMEPHHRECLIRDIPMMRRVAGLEPREANGGQEK